LKKFFLILALVILPVAVPAEETLMERPHWSVEVKGGEFIPAIDNWSQYYGKKYLTEFDATLAYKLWRPLEVGIEVGYLKETGQGMAPLHNVSAGTVTYELHPVNVFILARGIFSEDQWLVPYVGGGFTRMFYREEITGQNIARGAVNGRHARAGLQFLLDGIDSDAAGSFYRDVGVLHTYLFLEAKYTRAMADSSSGDPVNLGGKSWLAGLLFEF
jgi:hypothetical protein